MEEIPDKNPLEDKKRLAFEIVKDLNNEKKAQQALETWGKTFQKREIPEEMIELELAKGKENLMELLVAGKIVSSKGDFRRLIEKGAVTNLDTDEKITDSNFIPRAGEKFKIGKRRFVKVK